MNKTKIYFLGLITLVLFPIPAYFAVYYFSGINIYQFLQVDNLNFISIAYGIEFGFIYAILAIVILKAPIFEKIPLQIDQLVKNLKLNFLDAFFLSLCAGIGEELLFRAGIQTYLGVWITSIFFVAIHGYLSIKKPLMSLYGLVVLPFILIISYGFEHFGLWFSISAHFAYDLVLFAAMIQETSDDHR